MSTELASTSQVSPIEQLPFESISGYLAIVTNSNESTPHINLKGEDIYVAELDIPSLGDPDLSMKIVMDSETGESWEPKLIQFYGRDELKRECLLSEEEGEKVKTTLLNSDLPKTLMDEFKINKVRLDNEKYTWSLSQLSKDQDSLALEHINYLAKEHKHNIQLNQSRQDGPLVAANLGLEVLHQAIKERQSINDDLDRKELKATDLLNQAEAELTTTLAKATIFSKISIALTKGLKPLIRAINKNHKTAEKNSVKISEQKGRAATLAGEIEALSSEEPSLRAQLEELNSQIEVADERKREAATENGRLGEELSYAQRELEDQKKEERTALANAPAGNSRLARGIRRSYESFTLALNNRYFRIALAVTVLGGALVLGTAAGKLKAIYDDIDVTASSPSSQEDPKTTDGDEENEETIISNE